MPWISVLFLVLAAWVLLDHVGSRRIRGRVQQWAATLFAQAENAPTQHGGSIPGLLVNQIQNGEAFLPQTIRMKVKGARRSAPGKSWAPLEAKLFVAVPQAAAVFYADLTRWAFFSQKEVVYISEETFRAQRYLFSMLPQKTALTRDDVGSFLLLGLPWWPSLAAHPDLVWAQQNESVVDVYWKEAKSTYAVRWQLDEKNRWHQAELRRQMGEKEEIVLHVSFTEYRVFGPWSIPIKLSVVTHSAPSTAEVFRAEVTEWITDEPYGWW